MQNYDEQIALLTKRVYHLEQEIIRLGGQPYKSAKQAEAETVKPAEELLSQEKIAAASALETIRKEEPVSEAAPVPPVPELSQKTEPKHVAAKPKKDMENRIGKNVMAILASILIFFSLVLFAGIAFSFMSDTAKAVIMFIISAAIAVFGIIKMPKKDAPSDVKYGTFFTALAACGIGAIYITDLVAYFGFHCLPLIPFIISLALWIVITMFLAYKRSNIFIYICNAGLIIATVLTTLQFENSMLGFVVYTVCLAALYLISRHENYNADCFYFIQYPIVFVVLSSVVETNIYMYLVFALMLALVFAYANFMYRIETKQLPANIITAILNIAAIIRITCSDDNDILAYVSIALLLLTMLMYYIRHYKTTRGLFYAVYVVTYVVSIFIFLTTDMYIIVALVPFIPFLLAGFFKRDLVLRCGGYFALLSSFYIHITHFSFWPVFIIYSVVLLISTAYMMQKDYSVVDKYIQTILYAVFVGSIAAETEISGCFVFLIYALIVVVMNSKFYIHNFETKEKEISSQIVAYVASGYMILIGMYSIYSKGAVPETYQAIIYSLATLIVCLLNTNKLFNIKIPELLTGSYMCLKFTALIYVILHRLGAASFIISVVGILVAIVCIILGFSLKHKSFRLYGLVLSLICVIKLILFDIKYDSFLLRPVGFFVAGVLCFAISFIYSKLEKGVKQ